MNEIELFYLLKEKVLVQYQVHYPFFTGNWKTFSTEDIRNLIERIEDQTGQTLSEKWIYTHLKPLENQKLPRKDTLNILSEFVNSSSWDEFKFQFEQEYKSVKVEKQKHSSAFIILLISGIVLLVGLLFFILNKEKTEKHTIEIKNEFTQEKIKDEGLKIYELINNRKTPLKIKDAKIEVENKNTKIVVQSPYYQTEEVEIKKDENKTEITIKPDDYAMMLKAFMQSDIKDWETRKTQLNKILADDLEVIVMLKNDLGAEYFNKTDFIQMLVIPSENLKKMKIIQIENDLEAKIKFVRIKF